jgi:hypothetical protein
MTRASSYRTPGSGWWNGFCSLLRELAKFLDPSNPLQKFNRRLAWTFISHRPKLVIESRRLIPAREGYLRKSQALFFQQLLVRQPWIRDVAEVGFNVGHSSWIFLSSRHDVKVTSFDLGEHEYVSMTSDLVDSYFPERHELVLGDSRLTIPAFAKANPKRLFDLIYIDGGHDFDVAQADLRNCQLLAAARTIVIMDDLNPHSAWGVGPVRAWAECQEDGLVREDVLIEDGFPVVGGAINEIEVGDQVWALGHYVHPINQDDQRAP